MTLKHFDDLTAIDCLVMRPGYEGERDDEPEI